MNSIFAPITLKRPEEPIGPRNWGFEDLRWSLCRREVQSCAIPSHLALTAKLSGSCDGRLNTEWWMGPWRTFLPGRHHATLVAARPVTDGNIMPKWAAQPQPALTLSHRLWGWWGHDLKSRFLMDNGTVAHILHTEAHTLQGWCWRRRPGASSEGFKQIL